MADSVSSQIIVDYDNRVIMKFTNVSDGTGEAAVLKVDVSTLRGSPTEVTIERIEYDISGMQVQILFDATVDTVAYILSTGQYELDFSEYGGIKNNSGAGKTGDILFTTIGATANDTYAITLTMRKIGNVPPL